MKTGTSLAIKWILNVLLIAGLLAGSVTMVTAVNAKPSSPDQGLANPAYQAGTIPDPSYWTPERMRDAIPYDVIPDDTAPQTAAQNLTPQALGNPGWMPSRAPDTFFGTLVPTGQAGTYPAPTPTNAHTTTYVPGSDLYTFPYRATGKVFFVMAGRNFACSGAVIGEYTIWTAGHCASNGNGTFHSNWVFVPDFDNYTSPVPGPWIGTYFVAPFELTHNMDLSYDYAIVGVTPPASANGRSLRSFTGALGFAWNMPRAQKWKLLGYPILNFDGLRMVYSDSTYWADNSIFTPASVGVGSAIKSGGSGGPWILNFGFNQTGQINYLNGVNSYISATADEVYSPYLDERAKQLWDCSQNTAPVLDWNCFNTSTSGNLVLSYVPASDPAEPNAQFSYQINIHNPASTAATGVVLTDANNRSLVSADLPGGSCAIDGGTATCMLDSLAGDATVDATLVSDAPGPDAIENTLHLTFDQQKLDAQASYDTAVDCPGQITVTNTDDSGPGSLRAALSSVCSSGATIDFDPGLSGGTIHLQSELEVQGSPVTIDGSALPDPITLSGEGKVRVLNAPDTNLTLDNLIITKGQTSGEGGGIYAGLSLVLRNSLVTDNQADNGGGIYADGNLTVLNSSMAGNSAGSYGGGMYLLGADNSVQNSTLSGNRASQDGGGIEMENASVLVVTNSTLAGNTASGYGGGIDNYESTLTLTNSTLVGNSAASGGGLYSNNNGSLNYGNTIIAGSPSGGDCLNEGGTLGTNTNNLVEDGSCSATLSGDPKLGPLADNEGPTRTMALLTGSPAIDTGNDATCTASDQRGVSRPQGVHCDIGAFEWAIPDTVAPALHLPENVLIPADIASGKIVAFTVTASDAIDAAPVVVCDPPSGSNFPVGTSTVNCTATDLRGNESSGSFNVTVVLYTSRIRYAGPEAAGAGDCTSWADACTLQTALAIVPARSEVWVAAGTYKPTTGTDRAAAIQLPTKVAIYGGFAGTETAIDQRDWTNHVSILSGDLLDNDNENVRTDEPTRADNSYHVVSVSNFATLDGFTITGGNANGSDCPGSGCGGGVTGNLTDSTGLELANLTVRLNSANQGGGLYQFENIWSMTNSTISNNHADLGGGLYINTGHLTVTNSTFSNNSASNDGGGIYNLKAGVTLSDDTLAENSATARGGGIFNSDVPNPGYPDSMGVVIMTNSTLANNSAAKGGGVYNDSGLLTLTNSTLANNSVTEDGAGIYNAGNLNFANTIIANFSGTAWECFLDNATIGTDTNNLVRDGSCLEGGVNPLFGDPLLGPLADNGGPTQTMLLLPGSPAIDAGDDAICAAAPVNGLDQRGLPRPIGAHCDIGALEREYFYYFPFVSK